VWLFYHHEDSFATEICRGHSYYIIYMYAQT
jgi:hypothetical protein